MHSTEVATQYTEATLQAVASPTRLRVCRQERIELLRVLLELHAVAAERPAPTSGLRSCVVKRLQSCAQLLDAMVGQVRPKRRL